jgi:hypothetical protein
MRLAKVILTAAAVLLFTVVHARAIVYLNRQWNDLHKEWMISTLMVEGVNITLNREYQNAYGEAHELPPGPPFIVEANILVDNLYNEDFDVTSWGSLTITTDGMGGEDDFVLHWQATVQFQTKLFTQGPVTVTGTSGDPVIFTGTHAIITSYLGGADPTGDGSYTLSFRHCRFEAPQFDTSFFSVPFEFRGGNGLFENCTFKNFGNDFTHIIGHWDDTQDDAWTFVMRNCTFENNSLSEYVNTPIIVEHLRSVILENNTFIDNQFLPTQDACVVRVYDCAVERIAGNTGSGNTANSIHVRWYCETEGDAYISTSMDFPIILNSIHVGDDSSLEIAPGSLIKCYHADLFRTNFLVEGDISIDEVTFTSWEDDSLGGNTDFKPEPPYILRWGGANSYDTRGGIQVEPTGSIVVTDSYFKYAVVSINSAGNALIENCRFRLNSNGGVVFSGDANKTCTVRKCEIMNNEGHGVMLFRGDGPGRNFIVEDCTVIDNNDGFNLDSYSSTPTEISIKRCTISGNKGRGVFLMQGSGLSTIALESSLISANHYEGILSYDYNIQTPVFRVESNVIAGNGWYTGGAYDGAQILDGRLRFVNNTVALNQRRGIYERVDAADADSIANNIFTRNVLLGYVKDDKTLPYFAHNCFWGNDDANELFFDTPSGLLLTVEEVQALGGEFATNMHFEPQFRGEVTGTIAEITYDEPNNRSVIRGEGSPFSGRDLWGTILNPNTTQGVWFFVVSNSDYSITVSGDVSGVAAVGNEFSVFDHHLAAASNMRDIGRNGSVRAGVDVDRENRIIDGDEDDVAVVDIGSDEFDPDSVKVFLTMKGPTGGEHWLPGETYTISWSSDGIDSVDVLFTEKYNPASSVWIPIASHHPADSSEIEWEVPDEYLSPRCVIRVREIINHNLYAQSECFRIKDYELTRIAPDSLYEAYEVDRDGWRFGNTEENMWPGAWWSQFDYETGTDPHTGIAYPIYFTIVYFAKSQDFPDWPLFASTFGVGQCYYTAPPILIHRPSAVARWGSLKGEWGGSCAGFSASSFLAFDDKDAFTSAYPEVGGFNDLHDLAITEGTRCLVNKLWLYGFDSARIDHMRDGFGTRPAETLGEIYEMFLGEERVDRYLYIGNNNGSGAHAVNPYRIEKDTANADIHWVYVYDSNAPDSTTRRIAVDSVANTWDYPHHEGWGGDSLFFLMDPAATYLVSPVLPAAPASEQARVTAQSSPISYIEIYCDRHTCIAIEDDEGQAIGYADSAVFCDLPYGIPIMPPTGGFHPPYGYLVPESEYSVTTHCFGDSVTHVSFFTDSAVYYYERRDAEEHQTDQLTYGNSLSIANNDDETKSLQLEAISIHPDNEKAFDVLGFELAGDDSVHFSIHDGSDFDIVNYGGAKSYDLMLRLASESANPFFEHEGIDIPAASSHRVAPIWEGLPSEPVKILIDLGNDGTFDDSIYVDNQSVATLLQSCLATYNGWAVEIAWRLAEVDEGVEFFVLRAWDDHGFVELESIEIIRGGLTFICYDETIDRGETYRYRIEYGAGDDRAVLFETGPIVIPPLPLTLYQNYPNPFNPSTVIRYYLPSDGHVILEIFDVSGRRVARLIDAPEKKGPHLFEWDGRDQFDRPISSGLYFYRLRAGKQSISRKMLILR